MAVHCDAWLQSLCEMTKSLAGQMNTTIYVYIVYGVIYHYITFQAENIQFSIFLFYGSKPSS